MIPRFLIKAIENASLEGIGKKSFDLPKFFSNELKSKSIKDFKDADKSFFKPSKSEDSSLESTGMKEREVNEKKLINQYLEELKEKITLSRNVKIS